MLHASIQFPMLAFITYNMRLKNYLILVHFTLLETIWYSLVSRHINGVCWLQRRPEGLHKGRLLRWGDQSYLLIIVSGGSCHFEMWKQFQLVTTKTNETIRFLIFVTIWKFSVASAFVEYERFYRIYEKYSPRHNTGWQLMKGFNSVIRNYCLPI